MDGNKAGEILKSLVVLADMEACLRREKETAAEAEICAVVRMLTGSSSARGARVRGAHSTLPFL